MFIRIVFLGTLLGLLTACGGGGSGSPSPSPSPGPGPSPDPPSPGLTSEIEPNNDIGTAMAIIDVPNTLMGSVNLALDEFDYFVFTLNQAATVAIDLSGASMGADLDLALYDQTSTLIGISADDGATEHIEVSLDAGVAYYIEVEAFDTLGQTWGYTLNIAVSAAPQPAVETEPNDTFVGSNAFDVPGAVTGSVNDSSDQNDIFSLVPAQTGTHRIELQGQGGGAEDIDLAVYEYVNQIVTPIAGSQTSGQVETVDVELQSGGHYFLLVNAVDTQGIDLPYELSAELSGSTGSGSGTVTDEVEPNNSFATAFPVSIPVDVSGSLNDATDDVDVYILVPVQAGAFLIDLQGGAGSAFDLDLAVFDQNQVPLAVSAGPDQLESITISLAAGVSYYVAVDAFDTSGQTVPYDLTIGVAP
jgi:hypothetical protein